VLLSDLKKLKPILHYKALHSDDITGIGFSPLPNEFYTCSMDGLINVVDMYSKKQTDCALYCKNIKQQSNLSSH